MLNCEAPGHRLWESFLCDSFPGSSQNPILLYMLACPSPPDVLNFYCYILEPILATRYEVENERDVRPTPPGAFFSYG